MVSSSLETERQSDNGEASVAEAGDPLKERSTSVSAALLTVVPLRCTLAQTAPDGREMFLLLYRTSGRRGSPWHIAYELLDEDEDGRIDTLRVTRVRHAAQGEA